MPTSFDWIVAEYASKLGPSISAMAGAEASASPAAAEGAPEPGATDDLIWQQETGLAPGADLCILAPSLLWRGLGGRILEGAGLPEAADDEIRGTFLEIIQQALSSLGTSIGSRVGRELNMPPGASADTIERTLWHPVDIILAGDSSGQIFVSASPLLVQLLDAAAARAAEPPMPSPRAAAAAAAARSSCTLDLLMEVELPVGVSFGRSQMRLKDAIKLTTGSIVELNRSVTEPVEIIVNNCVIARGEVVVIEGNYGVRIRQIVSREERLRTLF